MFPNLWVSDTLNQVPWLHLDRLAGPNFLANDLEARSMVHPTHSGALAQQPPFAERVLRVPSQTLTAIPPSCR